MLSSHREQLFMLVFLAISCPSAFGIIADLLIVQSGFFAVAPSEFRPGWPLSIAMTVCKSVPEKVFVNAVLIPTNDLIDVYSYKADIIQPGETKLVTMMVPEIVLAPHSRAVLNVTTVGGVRYNYSEYISYNPASSLVFVETDKAIYKPGQRVQIRVVHVDKDLKPIIKPLTVFVVNPKDSKLEEFKDTSSRTGVTEVTYDLLDSASLGIWKIQVKDEASMLYTKEFTVEEYVLPKFSVTVKANPGYIVYEKGISGSSVTVEALYTYGRGVQGQCNLVLSVEHQGKETRVQTTKQLSDLGKAEFSDLDWRKFSNIIHSQEFKVHVTASVTDETGRTEAGQSSVIFYKYPVKVQILPKTTQVFRPGIPASIAVRVSDHSGNPIGTSEVSLSIKVVSMKQINHQMVIPDGETDATYQFTPQLEEQAGHYERYWRWRVGRFGRVGTITATLNSDSQIVSSLPGYMYLSHNDTAVSVRPASNQRPVVGQKYQFQVLKNAPEDQQTPSYLVVSQGNILEAGHAQGDVIDVSITMEMCPQAKLFVYMIVGRQDTEVVTDVVEFSPTHCLGKEVSVHFDAAEIRSGADTTMKVHVDRVDGSNALSGIHNVYYLGIDKSLVLLQGRTDLNTEQVMSGLSSLNLKSRFQTLHGSPPHSASQMIEATGLTGFATIHLVDQVEHFGIDWSKAVFVDSDAEMMKQDIGVLREVAMEKEVATEAEEEEEEQSVDVKVRKDFPETWLWGSAHTDMHGRLNQAVKLPDTITSWFISAFAVSDDGLAVGSGPFELAAVQKFFLTMNLPYSIKRGEVFMLRVTVFNYRDKAVSATVRLARSNQFSVVDTSNDSNSEWISKQTDLPAGRASSVEFKISATTLGLIELHMVAEDLEDGMKDEVKQMLLVKPEGEMRSRAITEVLFLKSSTVTSHTFALNWPEEKIVPGSKHVEVKVTGAILGQALSNLDRLVSIPYGCGEQNMITTVPNIYGLTYIQANDKEDYSDMTNKMLKNMKTGYQRQVDNYRHVDGSFSAWGDKHGSSNGSVWLTAFVLKSFSRASQFISLDSMVLSSAARFLANQQDMSGAFRETGQVFHSEMQSGTGTGSALTIYVLISLLEANEALKGDLLNLKPYIDLTVGYIQENLKPANLRQDGNKFLAAMAAYAVSLLPDSRLASLVDELLSVVTDKEAPWAVSQPANRFTNNFESSSMSRNIEVVSYYLLALTRLQRLEEGLVIMKWLQSQQNSLGGYYSTQDTIMALQALAEFGVVFKGSSSANLVKVREPQSGQSFNVSLEGSRAMLLHTVELPEETKTVEVIVNGPFNGSCIVKVVYTYYTLAGDDDEMTMTESLVFVDTKTWKVSNTIHNVEACIRSSKSLKYSGMFVTTLTLPSGEAAFDVPATILAHNPRASRVEVDQGLIHFYVDQAPGDDGLCFEAKMERKLEFEVQKPGSAKIYAYYEPGTSQEVALALSQDKLPCFNGKCDGNDSQVVIVSVTKVLLTVAICTLVTLMLCM